MKPGAIIENYQGQFAKVIRVKDEMTHFTAWVKSKDLADAETVAVNRLNEFGLSQVLATKKQVEASGDGVTTDAAGAVETPKKKGRDAK